MRDSQGSSPERKYPIGNVGLGLSLEGLQGTAEPWEGLEEWELAKSLLEASPRGWNQCPALGGGAKTAQDLLVSSGDANHGIQGWSHILPQAGARWTRCVARMGPVPRSRCPRSIRGGDITASGLISRPAAVSRFLSNLCARSRAGRAPSWALVWGRSPRVSGPRLTTPRAPKSQRGPPGSSEPPSGSLSCLCHGKPKSFPKESPQGAPPALPVSYWEPGALLQPGRSLCHHHPGHFGPHPGLRCHPAFRQALRQQLLTPTQGWLKITPRQSCSPDPAEKHPGNAKGCGSFPQGKGLHPSTPRARVPVGSVPSQQHPGVIFHSSQLCQSGFGAIWGWDLGFFYR